MHTFNLSLIDGAWSSRLSRKAHSAVGPSQTTTELCSRHRSKLYPKLSTVRFALLSLCVLISLFQLMFAGCALQEVSGAGAQMTSFALISTALQWQVVINGDLWPW